MFAEIRNNLVILIGTIVLFVIAVSVDQGPNPVIDSMLWPKIVLGLLFLLSLSSLARNVLDLWEQKDPAQKDTFMDDDESFESSKTGRACVVLAFLYVWLVETTGYFLATLVMIPVLMVLLTEKRVMPIALTTLLYLVFVWAVFVQLASLLLPAGMGIFRDWSHFIMF